MVSWEVDHVVGRASHRAWEHEDAPRARSAIMRLFSKERLLAVLAAGGRHPDHRMIMDGRATRLKEALARIAAGSAVAYYYAAPSLIYTAW